MFKRNPKKDKLKDAFEAGFSSGWDTALKELVDSFVKKENQTEENELQWEAMTNGRSTGTSEEN